MEKCYRKLIDDFEKKNNMDNNKKDGNNRSCGSIMMVKNNGRVEMNEDENLWILDSASTKHISKSMKGMSDIKEVKNGKKLESISGELMDIKYVGKFTGKFTDKEGFKHLLVVDDVVYLPEAEHNLISVTKAMKQGYNISNDEELSLILSKGDVKVVFDIKIETEDE